MATVGTKYTSLASTEEKIRTLARKKPNLGDFLNKTFGVEAATRSEEEQTQTKQNPQFDKHTRNLLQTLFSTEIKETQQGPEEGKEGESKFSSETSQHDTAGLKEDLENLLKPISSFSGTTLGMLPGMLESPVGPETALPSSLNSIIDKVNPDFVNKLDGTFKTLKATELQNLGNQLFGGLRNLTTGQSGDNALPFGMAPDLYTGLQSAMGQASKIVDKITALVQKLFLGTSGVLDIQVPTGIVEQISSSLGGLTNNLGPLAQKFGGFESVTKLTDQFQSQTSQFQSLLSDPQQLLESYMPPQASQFLGNVRDPSQFLQKLIPPQLSSQLEKLNDLPGLGFTGNLGYGLDGVLSQDSDSVIQKVLSENPLLKNILSPNLTEPVKEPNVNETQEDRAKDVKVAAASTNENIPQVHGVPVELVPPRRVLPTKTASSSQGLGSPKQKGGLSLFG